MKNREILFRGKRVENGDWVEGRLLADDVVVPTTQEFEIEGNAIFGCDLTAHIVYKQTVGQYTGLTDKNGKKIFEGDIIECDSERFIIVWDADFAGFYLDDIDPDYEGCVCIDDASKDGYIIGNIHDGGIEI